MSGRTRALLLAAALVALVVVAWFGGGYDLGALATAEERGRGLARLQAFLGSLAGPNLEPSFLTYAGGLALTSLAIAVVGTLFAVALGLPLALAASAAVNVGDAHGVRRTLRRVVCEGARLVQDILRGVPDFVWAVFLVPLFGLGAQTGVLAIGLNTAGILARVYSEAFDAVPGRQLAPIRAVGAGRLQTFLYGILPRVQAPVLSFTLLRWECAVRNAAVIGAVGAGGLGDELRVRISYGEYDKVLTGLLLMLLMTVGSDILSGFVRRRLGHEGATAAAPVALALARRRLLGLAIGLVGAIVLAALWIGGDLWRLVSPAGGTWGQKLEFMGAFFADFARPKVDALDDALLSAGLPLSMALLATVGATALAACAAYAGSRAVARLRLQGGGPLGRALRAGVTRVVRLLIQGVSTVLRGVPEIFWAYLLVSFFLPGPLAGLVALVFHTVGILVRLFLENLDSVPHASLAVVQASAVTPAKTFFYGALPAVAPHWLANAFFQFESNVRTGIVLGVVGVGGLGHLFEWNFSFFHYRDASTCLIVIVLLSLVLDRISRRLGIARTRLSG